MEKRFSLWGFTYWLPRVLALLFIIFLGLFSLDVFGQGYGFWGTALAFFMHNIPALFLLAVLIIFWKREIIAGIVFILAGLLYVGLIFAGRFGGFAWYKLSWILTISGPAFITGILFVVNWIRRREKTDKVK